jgi:fucose 4-O-acetylase-like acetyltransferase
MSASEAPSSPRLAALDAARVLATYGIVWCHVCEAQKLSPPWPALGRWGTSFYVILAAVFLVLGRMRAQARPMPPEILRKARRLLWPFLVWCLIYGAYYGARGYSRGYSWEGLTRWWGPVAGTAVHLWFLPFVFFWGVLATLWVPRLLKLPQWLLLVGGAITSTALYWFCYRWLHFAVSRPWLWEYHLHRLDRWIVEIPPFVTATLGATFFFRLSTQSREFLKKKRVPLAALGLLGFAASQTIYATQLDAIQAATHTQGRFMANSAALFFLVFAAALSSTGLVARIAPWGRYTYVAFLAHMLFVELIRDSFKSLPGYGSAWFALGSSLLVFGASLWFSWAVAHTRALRFLRA